MDRKDIIWLVDHRPIPGPDYWNWRCLRCGEPVSVHPGFFTRLFRRVMGR